MAKMYTLDNKLLVGTPEIRIGDVIVPVDDREKTVKKVMKLMNREDPTEESIDEVLKLVLSKENYKKIDEMNMPWAAYQELISLVMSAITGADPTEPSEERFQEG